MTYNVNKAADDFIAMLWKHHPEADDARSISELLEYVACDLLWACQREGVSRLDVLRGAWRHAQNNPAQPRPGLHDPEPDLPTYDEALGAKCDAEARVAEARKLNGMV